MKCCEYARKPFGANPHSRVTCGKKKRKKDLVFDRDQSKVLNRLRGTIYAPG